MITTTENRVSYATNGSTVAFPVPFRFIESDELTVIVQILGVNTVATEGTDYSVTGVNDPDGGLVTFNTAPATGTLFIVRDSAARQEVDLVSKDNFRAETVEEALDRMTMLIQELRRKVRHCIHTQITESEADLVHLELPYYVDRASTLMGFDGEGQLKLYDLDIDTLMVDVNAVIADGSITAAKLASSLDLSSKTITYPPQSISASNLASTMEMQDNTVVLPPEAVNDPVCIPNSISSGSLNPTLRLRKVLVNPATTPDILVENAGVANANGSYTQTGTVNGYPKYTNSNNYYIAATADGKRWKIFDNTDVAVYESYHYQWDTFQGTIEPTPDQMPIPWYLAGTSTTIPAMRVTVDAEDVEVGGNVKATSFIGDGSQLTGVVAEATDTSGFTVAMLPSNKPRGGVGGTSSSGSDASLMFKDSKGYVRFFGYNNTGVGPFITGANSSPVSPSMIRPLKLNTGTLASASVTQTCDYSGSNAVSIALGSVIKILQTGAVAVVLTSTGLVFTIGNGAAGTLGLGSTTDYSQFQGVKIGAHANKTIRISDIQLTAVHNSTAGGHVIAIDVSGKVWTWGEGGSGQLGNGTANKTSPYNNPAWLFDGEVVQQVIAVGKTSYVLTASGKVYGTGANAKGQLGISGDTTDKSNFTLATNTGTTIIASSIYAAGRSQAANDVCLFALTASGALYSCGYGGQKSLGQGASTSNLTALTLVDASIGTISKLFVMGATYPWCYAVKSNGSVICWGYNGSGQLGNGTTTNSGTAVTPTGLATLLGNPTSDSAIVDIHGLRPAFTVGVNDPGGSTVILDSQGRVFCVGGNTVGELGTGGNQADTTAFEQIPTSTVFSSIWSSGRDTVEPSLYLIDTAGNLWAAGSNAYGGLSEAVLTFPRVDFPVKVRI